MHIPHHLVRSTSGRWSFRQRVPQDPQAKLGQRVIKRTLRTTELRQAQVQAIGLASSYAQVFNAVRGLPMGRMTTQDVDALVERLTQEPRRKDLTLHRPQALDGTVTEQWQIDNEEDLRLYRKAQGWAAPSEVASIGMLPPELIEQRKPALASFDEIITMKKVRDAWLATGARALEVGQLPLNDVFKDGNVVCIRTNDEGEIQKVKTDASLRTVPVHPDLLDLGFWEWTEELRAKGHDRPFPQAKANATNGAGNRISKALSRHVAEIGKNWPKAKRGFHSLRKPLTQELQGAGVPSELPAQIIGHEIDDKHHTTYSREFTHQEKLHGLSHHSPDLVSLTYSLKISYHKLLIIK